MKQFKAIKSKELAVSSPSAFDQSLRSNQLVPMPFSAPSLTSYSKVVPTTNRALEVGGATKGLGATYASEKREIWGKSDENWLKKTQPLSVHV